MKANDFVPPSERANTPLVLKATAGLRLLQEQEADNLLNAVRDVFHKSGYIVSDNAVEIMDGIDEGIYSWFTINFLLGMLYYRFRVFLEPYLLCFLPFCGISHFYCEKQHFPRSQMFENNVYNDFQYIRPLKWTKHCSCTGFGWRQHTSNVRIQR